MALTRFSWPRLSLQIFGFGNLLLAGVGLYYLLGTTARVLADGRPGDEYFRYAYFILTSFNLLFLITLTFTGIGLMRADVRRVFLYNVLAGFTFVYAFVNGALWLMPDPWGMAIGGASGIGNMGMAPWLYLPFPLLYPVVSLVFLNLARRRIGPQPSHGAESV